MNKIDPSGQIFSLIQTLSDLSISLYLRAINLPLFYHLLASVAVFAVSLVIPEEYIDAFNASGIVIPEFILASRGEQVAGKVIKVFSEEGKYLGSASEESVRGVWTSIPNFIKHVRDHLDDFRKYYKDTSLTVQDFANEAKAIYNTMNGLRTSRSVEIRFGAAVFENGKMITAGTVVSGDRGIISYSIRKAKQLKKEIIDGREYLDKYF